MKKTLSIKKVKSFLLLILLFTFLGLFTQCKKAIENLINPISTITFINPTYTTIDITFNGETKSILPGGSVVFTANASTVATGSAATSGKTVSGSQVGHLMTWSLVKTFPEGGGNINSTLDVGSDYFFLKIQNTSSVPIQKLYVNYGFANQTVDNISIPNTGLTYDIGYYLAFTNSNVRAENGGRSWYWNPLNLSFTNNQSKTLAAF